MLTLDVVSDFACPWCFIGTRRLSAVLAETKSALAGGVSVQHHPFLLNPDLPPEGADLRNYLRQRYGGDPEAMFARVESAAREVGLPLDFAKIRRFPHTVGAHTLVRHAAAHGDTASFVDTLFSAYFLDGLDLGDPVVLTNLAVRHGLDAATVSRLLGDPAEAEITRETAAGLSAQGIGGVPFFVFDRRLALSGAQPAEAFRQTLAQAAR